MSILDRLKTLNLDDSKAKFETGCDSISFVKYSGCGNDFVIIDNRQHELSLSTNAIKQLSHRHHGIGADGLIFLESSQRPQTPYRMRIFNADGSEAEMCGNGLRCLAHYIRSLENVSDFYVETMRQHFKISFAGNLVTLQMPSPTLPTFVELTIDAHSPKEKLSLHFLDTGVPHTILFVDDIEDNNLISFAPKIRHHPHFQPAGTNVNFAKIIDEQTVKIRTYERGVEGETLACGTGAVAAAIVGHQAFQLKAPIQIITRSGDCLTINFDSRDQFLTNLTMTGPAFKIFEGTLNCAVFGFQLKSSTLIQ
jgi:diaminopimelate epimerase